MARHILVVDDDPGIRGMIATVLQYEGYSVETAANGRDALVRIDARRPHLIFLDLQMPVMTGQQLLAQLREANTGIPVVFMSAGYRVRLEAERCGADGYLAKPFELDDVLTTVERFAG